MYKCIDLSEYQKGPHDWQAIKNNGVQAAIIRAGEIYNGQITEDEQCLDNFRGANSVGLPTGGYFYSCANSIEMAYAEAQFLVDRLAGHEITMPCYVDLEEPDEWLQQNANDIIQVYVNVLKTNGYIPGVYANYNWFKNYIDLERWKDIPLWIAQNPKMTLPSQYFGMWQWGSSNIDGIAKNPTDTNELYIPYWETINVKVEPVPVEQVPPVIIPPQEKQPMSNLGVEYQAHMQDIGWGPWVADGLTAGTVDESRRIEAIRFRLTNKGDLDVNLLGNPHIENIGWSGFVGENEICGTVGESLKLQALQFALRGADADKFSIQARAENVQNLGSMSWVTGEGLLGTTGGDLRLEAIQMLITKSGVDLGNNGAGGFKVIEHVPIPPTPEIIQTQNIPMASEHFAWQEFACDCIPEKYNFGWCDGFPDTGYDHSMHPDLVVMAEQLRQAVNAPIFVSSGVRCPRCNSFWGGVPNSEHLRGEAFDSYCPSLSLDDYAAVANSVGLGVLIYYTDNFLHCRLNNTGIVVYQW